MGSEAEEVFDKSCFHETILESHNQTDSSLCLPSSNFSSFITSNTPNECSTPGDLRLLIGRAIRKRMRPVPENQEESVVCISNNSEEGDNSNESDKTITPENCNDVTIRKIEPQIPDKKRQKLVDDKVKNFIPRGVTLERYLRRCGYDQYRELPNWLLKKNRNRNTRELAALVENVYVSDYRNELNIRNDPRDLSAHNYRKVLEAVNMSDNTTHSNEYFYSDFSSPAMSRFAFYPSLAQKRSSKKRRI